MINTHFTDCTRLFSGTGFSREEGSSVADMIVPTLRVVTQPRTLRVPKTTRIQACGGDAEHHRMHPHAERGNDQNQDQKRV